MAGRTHGSGSGAYLRVVGERLFQKTSENHPGAERREYVDPSSGDKKFMYGIWYDDWYGFIVGIEKKESRVRPGEYILEIKMQDQNETVNIQVVWGSRHCYDFLKRICSPDFKPQEMCAVNPWVMEVDGKEKPIRGLSIIQSQDNKSLKSPFVEGDLPSWVAVDIGGGKKAWNRDAFEEALMAKVNEVIAKLRSPEEEIATPPPADVDLGDNVEGVNMDELDEEDSDLPF